MGHSSDKFRTHLILSLAHTPGELIAHTDASSRIDFDFDKFDSDRVCFAINNNYFARSELFKPAEIETERVINKIF